MVRFGTHVIAALAAVSLLAGCGGGGTPAAPDDEVVSIEHIYGSTGITGAPQRVVALSSVDADTAAALGVPPVLAPQPPGTEPGTAAPWFADATAGTEVEIIDVVGGDQGGQIPFEQIAAADPDLILGTGSGITAQDHATLSDIAPTVAPEIGEFRDPWFAITRTIGRALGQAEQAEELVTRTEDVIAAAAAEHPEFEGRTFVAALLFATDQFGMLVDTEESTVSLMRGLGFTLQPEVDALEATSGYATQVSRERVGLLDSDVTIAYAPDAEVARQYLDDPLVAQLDVVQRDAFIPVDRLLWGAFRNPSVLSIPYSVEQIVPQLAAVDLGAP